MRKLMLCFLFASASFIFGSCKDNGEESTTTTTTDNTTTTTMPPADGTNTTTTTTTRYVRLGNGAPVTIDTSTGRYVDESGSPVDFYVDLNSNDTFYGETGQNVNGGLIYENNTWRLDNTKVKIDKSKMKVKSGDDKMKTNGQ